MANETKKADRKKAIRWANRNPSQMAFIRLLVRNGYTEEFFVALFEIAEIQESTNV